MRSPRLKGVIAAVPTPVTPEGEPDLERFLQHAAWALDNGCDALNVLGTTGEATSFSAGQRKNVMRAAISGLDRSRLMVGTGTPDLKTSVELTRFAYEIGFAAALVLPPYYYKGVSEEGLFTWFDALVSATADTPINIYLYNFPQMTGIRFSPGLVARLAQTFPERIIGAKDSSGDLDYARELARIPGFDVFPSNEAALARVDQDGYAGCISATVNVAPALSARLWKDRTNAKLLKEASAVRAMTSAKPLIPAVKYLVGRIHGDAAFERLVPPHFPLTDEDKNELRQQTEGASFMTTPA